MPENIAVSIISILRELIKAKDSSIDQTEKCAELFACIYRIACKMIDPAWESTAGKRKLFHCLFSAASTILTSSLYRNPNIISALVDCLQELAPGSMFEKETPEDRLCITATGGESKGYRTLYVTIGAGLIASYYVPTIVQGNYSVTGCGCGSFAESNVIAHAKYQLSGDHAFDRQQLISNRFAYLHAPFYHPILEVFAEERGALAFPDVFKLTTALTDPLRSSYQYFGIWDKSLAKAVAIAMKHLPHIKSGFVVCSDTIDEFLDYGVHVNKTVVTPWQAGEKYPSVAETLASTACAEEEWRLIKCALQRGPDSSDDIRHRIIWRNAALALTACDEPSPSRISDAFQMNMEKMRKSHKEICAHADNVVASWAG